MKMLSWLFGSKKTIAQLLQENKRMLEKAIRELDRERNNLQNQEKKIIIEIKQTAKQGQMDAVKAQAKQLVRNRHAIAKMHQMKTHLQAISLRISSLKSTKAMADAMSGATKSMKAMNKQLNVPMLQKIMRQFEMQNDKMDLTSQMMEDTIDETFEQEEEQDEGEDLVNQVLDEIGINTDALLASAPEKKVINLTKKQIIAQAESVKADHGGIDEDLQTRLNNLRKK